MEIVLSGDAKGDSVENLKVREDGNIDYDSDDDYDDVMDITLYKAEDLKSLCMFPSKAGGVPVWLDPDPVSLPSGRSCCCDICGEPLQFLLQVYAPVVGMHRTFFVFMCLSTQCLIKDQHEQHLNKASRSVKVFRCQLPDNLTGCLRRDEADIPSRTRDALCKWCGTWRGVKVCSVCKTPYCSVKHQVMHWRSGHGIDCPLIKISSQSAASTSKNSRAISVVASKTLWEEVQLTEIPFVEETSDSDNGGLKSDPDEETSDIDGEENAKGYSRDPMDETVLSLLGNFESDDDKKSWVTFMERISEAPDQVLRFNKSRRASAKPLWPMTSGRLLEDDIRKCSYCDGRLRFEFQVMPQLLYKCKMGNNFDSLDWLTIVVYTCESSCESSSSYKEEFVWIQLKL